MLSDLLYIEFIKQLDTLHLGRIFIYFTHLLYMYMASVVHPCKRVYFSPLKKILRTPNELNYRAHFDFTSPGSGTCIREYSL